MKFFLLLIIIIKTISSNLLKFPFTLDSKSPSNLTNYFFNLSYISSIKIGTPSQSIKIQFLFDSFSLFFPGNSFNGFYNEKKSKSFQKISNFFSEFDFSIKYPFGLKSKENFIINNKKIDLNFFLIENIVNNSNNKIDFKCGAIGLNIKTFFNKNEPNFIQQLKEKNFIDSFCFTIKFINENDGIIFFGKLPHEYEKNNKKYYEKYFRTISGNGESFFKFWGMICKNVYYGNLKENFNEKNFKNFNKKNFFNENNNKKNFNENFEKNFFNENFNEKNENNNKKNFLIENFNENNNENNNENFFNNEVIFNPRLKGIEGTFEFQNFIDKEFFGKYFKNGMCKVEKFRNELKEINYSCYICDSSINLTSYLPLNFYEPISNFTFILDKFDLFKKHNNKFIYQIFFRDEYNGLWTLGDVFFKKYQITFDQDKKIIGFYISENKQFNYLYIVIIILIITLFFLFYYLLKIYLQFKIKPKNVINEYYDYKPNSLNKIFIEIS
jgi:hypothetical protein